MNIDDKIKGALYGMALGDALGLGTEFMTRQEVMSYYPDGLTDFSQFIHDMHRSLYKPGEWTNDTEVILRMLEPILEDEAINLVKIAERLHDWYLEDNMDMNEPYRVVIPTEGWVKNPIVVCHRAWKNAKTLGASNEALNRAFIIGIFANEDVTIEELSRRLVNMTHDDERCVATTAMAAHLVSTYLYENRAPSYEELYELCRNIDERALAFLKMSYEGKLEDFHIDDEDTCWYTRKSLGVAMWALWHCKTPEEMLYKMVNAGGDADTNASLALMLAGFKYGYSALPALKEKIIGKERLDEMADRLSALVKKKLKIKIN